MDFKHYWICAFCATERGGVAYKTGNTVAQMPCGYCKGKKHTPEEYTTPVRDFRWPENE